MLRVEFYTIESMANNLLVILATFNTHTFLMYYFYFDFRCS